MIEIKEPTHVEDTGSPRSGFSKIYQIHKYFGRKPWKPIADLIKQNTNEGDHVLDIFVGSGVTALESIAINRNFTGIDLNPIAIFIAKNTINSNFDEKEFTREYKKLKEKLNPFFEELYSTEECCEYCESNMKIIHINVGPNYEGREEGYFYCPKCGRRKSNKRRTLTEKELEDFNKEYPIDKWIPKNDFPDNFYKDRFSYKGVDKIVDMFTDRNLYGLSELLHTIKNMDFKYENLFLIAFSNTLLHASILKGEDVRPLGVNNYWIPDDYMEENVWLRFKERVDKVIKSKRKLKDKLNNLSSFNKGVGNHSFKNTSSTSLDLDSNTIDYIITDPPYGDGIQYSELSKVWNAWLQFEYEIDNEIIVNPEQNKGKDDFINLLKKSIKEGARVLKDNKKFTLCFHNKKFSIWKDVLDIFKENDLVLEKITIVDQLGNSYNNNWAKFSPKNDLYLTFIKQEFKGYTHSEPYDLKNLIKKIMKKNKDSSCTQIYDKLVSTMIWEIFYNDYQIDLSDLSIKKANKMMQEIEEEI